MSWILIALLALGCGRKDPLDTAMTVTETTPTAPADVDGDGYDETVDCDDADPSVHPGASETPYDGLDNDCDPATPDDDLDGDGYRLEEDSDDSDVTIYPGAPELCDEVQNDSDAADWTTANEVGVATFFDSDGRVTDWTSALSGSATVSYSGELWVCEGSWSVNLIIDADDVAIIGSGASITHLDGGGLGSVITAIDVSGLSLEGVTLTGGDAEFGGGLYLAGSSATLTGAVVSGNTAYERGGGLHLEDHSSATLTNTTVSDNTIEHDDNGLGGGLSLTNSSATLMDSEVSGNTAYYSAGLFLYESIATLDGSEVSGNTAESRAGGLFIIVSDVTLTDSTVSGNTAGDYGGGLALYESSVTLTGARVSDNTSYRSGGGLYLSHSSATLMDSEVSGNTADLGGGVCVFNAETTLSVTNSDFVDNLDEDIYLSAVSAAYDWGLAASFTCDASSCY